MAKVNLKDATKGLVDEASEILEKAAGSAAEACVRIILIDESRKAGCL